MFFNFGAKIRALYEGKITNSLHSYYKNRHKNSKQIILYHILPLSPRDIPDNCYLCIAIYK